MSFNPTATGTGIPKIVSGVQTAAAALVVDADVNAAAAIAGTKVAPNFGAQNIVTTGFASVGTTPATTGVIRLPNGSGTSAINAMNGAANADITVCEVTSGNLCTVGGDINLTKVCTSLYALALTSVICNVASSARLTIDNTFAYFQVPIVGGVSTPYGVHGSVLSAMTNADYLVPASEYCYQEFIAPATLTLTAARLVKLPTPAVESFSYTKEIVNLNAGAFALTVSRADGAGVTVSIAQNFKGTVRVRPAGVYLVAPVSAAP